MEPVVVSPRLLITICTTKYLLLLLHILPVTTEHFDFETVKCKNSSSVSHLNPEDCSLWSHYDSTTQTCNCLLDWLTTCHGKNVYIDSGTILLFNEKKGILSLFKELSPRYRENISDKVELPTNISLLNEFMCAPLNRKGYLCSECKEGYGPSLVLFMCSANVCYQCNKSPYGIILYLLVEILPITILYLVILIFHIRLTSAPMTCFIVYSQLIVYALNKSCSELLLNKIEFVHKEGNIRTITKIILTAYGIFNLDLVRYAIPPFCISSKLGPIHVAFLGYFSAFYPYLLIMLTWLCIELHGRNFKVLVLFWKPFHNCFVKLRYRFSTGGDLGNAFATFFLLSYDRIMYQTLTLTNTYAVYNFPLSNVSTMHYYPMDYMLSIDAGIKFGSAKYALVTTITVMLFCVFNVLPALFITLYPAKKFREATLPRCKLWMSIALNTFVEKFHHCYKDGLDGGKDMRYFAGFYFFLRIAVVLFVVLLSNAFLLETWFLRGTVFSISTVVIALCQPYKKTKVNVADTVLLFYLATLCHLLSANGQIRYFVPSIHAMLIFPFIVFIFLFLYNRSPCKNKTVTLSCINCFKHLKAFATSTAAGSDSAAAGNVNATTDRERTIRPASYGAIN